MGSLRTLIRHEVIDDQLANHVRDRMTVLDVGCGQGTQALKLAARGCRVTGVDPSPDLLGRFATAAAAAGVEVELIEGRIGDLADRLGDRRFDLVCAHGVLMYLDDRADTVAALAARVAGHGRLSVTVRNAHALAMRPGLRRDWPAAIAAFETNRYVNELGVSATADRLEDLESYLVPVGFCILEWYGVRVLNDAVPADMAVPAGEDLGLLLDAEIEAGRRDPYRWMASQLHIIAGEEDAGR